MSILGDRIVQLRKAKGWTQTQLGTYAGVNESYLCGIEKGRRINVRIEYLKKLGRSLDTSIDYLAGLTDDARPPAARQQYPKG